MLFFALENAQKEEYGKWKCDTNEMCWPGEVANKLPWPGGIGTDPALWRKTEDQFSFALLPFFDTSPYVRNNV